MSKLAACICSRCDQPLWTMASPRQIETVLYAPRFCMACRAEVARLTSGLSYFSGARGLAVI